MSADFWAGYLSGAVGILVGNPLDLVKVRLQAQPAAEATLPATHGPSSALPSTAASAATSPTQAQARTQAQGQAPPTRLRDIHNFRTLLRGLPAPILTYGALNALLFTTYNRSLAALSTPGSDADGGPRTSPGPAAHFAAGAAAGLATFVLSAPTELVKCRAQVAEDVSRATRSADGGRGGAGGGTSSWAIFVRTLRSEGVAGLFHGGAITSVRDAVGYGFYFWTYEISRGWFEPGDGAGSRTGVNALKRNEEVPGVGVNVGSSAITGLAKWYQNETAQVLLCGGLAGVATWLSIFPLDVIKTRVQTQDMVVTTSNVGSGVVQAAEETPMLRSTKPRRLGAIETARLAYRTEGAGVFFRGLTVCCVRAFIVNAVQWAVYEWVMAAMLR